ncbi:MAG: diacylglycerol kinase family protein [Microscillaceae bacterium]|jgi:undecaprenol kinase/diacylglycerol kinase (ATP)|nr:diacylglycerol kinase family protein [Microscillaceae bacterium]
MLPKIPNSANKNFFYQRILSFKYALQGIYYLLRTQPNAWVHLIISTLVGFFGFYFRISLGEWQMILLAMGLVLSAEGFNTALEVLVDWLSPEYQAQAGIVKDVSAGAVLLAAIAAAGVGILIFLPKFYTYFF